MKSAGSIGVTTSYNCLVSIIMPCLNSEATIAEAIQSIISQDYPSIEVIVIDDGSVDSTYSIVQEYISKDSRIKSFRNTGERGVAMARNVGLRAANGKYVCFLDSDDYLLPGSIRRRVALAAKNSLNLVFGSYVRLLPNGETSIVSAPRKVAYRDMLKKNYIGNLTGFYDAEYFGRIFQDSVRHEDYLMWCTMLQRIDFAYSTGAEPLGVYRVSSKSLSGNKFKAFYWHWLILREGLDQKLLPAIYYQSYYFLSSFFDRANILFRRSIR